MCSSNGIRVNAVAPTFIETPLTAPMFREAGFRQEIEGRSPMGRVGEPRRLLKSSIFSVARRHRL